MSQLEPTAVYQLLQKLTKLHENDLFGEISLLINCEVAESIKYIKHNALLPVVSEAVERAIAKDVEAIKNKTAENIKKVNTIIEETGSDKEIKAVQDIVEGKHPIPESDKQQSV